MHSNERAHYQKVKQILQLYFQIIKTTILIFIDGVLGFWGFEEQLVMLLLRSVTSCYTPCERHPFHLKIFYLVREGFST